MISYIVYKNDFGKLYLENYTWKIILDNVKIHLLNYDSTNEKVKKYLQLSIAINYVFFSLICEINLDC